MEEQLLPWWKRALRAAIGTLRSGFGFFGKPHQDVAAAEPIQTKEPEQSASPRGSEPEPEAEIKPVEISELKEVEIEAQLPEEHVDEFAEPESIETNQHEVVVTREPEIEEVVVAEPELEIEEIAVAEHEPRNEEIIIEVLAKAEESEPEEDVTLVEEVENEPAETDAEPEIEDVVIAEAEPEVQEVEAEPEAVEVLVDVQVAEEARETEIFSVEEGTQAEVDLDAEETEVEEIHPIMEEPELETVEYESVTVEAEPVVDPVVEIEQESASEVTMETIPEPEDSAKQEEVSDVEQEEVMAESVPEITNEVEEMKPLREEESLQPETAISDSLSVEVEQESAQLIETESVADVSTVEAVSSIATPVAIAMPVEMQANVVPETAPVAETPAEPHPIRHAIKEDDDKSSPFSIIVSQVYEGPMDLLLDLIRKQDIDIYDIPIAKITEQFLVYVERLRASDMDMAGEFIYTASLLIHIKSKTLLPRAPSGSDDQFEDPRRELVERLLEHERFKNAAQMLQQKQMIEDATWTNPGLREFKGDAGTEPELAADTVDLVRVFQEILDRARNRPVINVEEDSVTVGQMIQFLGRRLNMEDKPIALRKLLAHTHSQRALVAMFLALLELVRLQAVLLRQDRLFSEIFIKKHEGFDTVMTEGFLAARDDWQ